MHAPRRKRPRDSAAVRVFPPGIPLLAVMLGVGADRLSPIDFGSTPLPIFRYSLGGLIVVGSLLGLGLWSVLLLRRTGQSENPWTPTTEIIERGPFRWSRNPMYLQMVAVCFGLAIMLWNVWILALVPAVAWTLQKLAIEPEEAYLDSKFGEPYAAYRRRVRRWI